MKERAPQNTPEEVIQNLVDDLEIMEGIRYEFYKRGPWYKEYGNTSDPDGEYEIKIDKASVKSAYDAKNELLEFGNRLPEFLGYILESLLSKQLPADETRYVLSKTETGFQIVHPEPSDELGWTWVNVPESKRMVDDTVLGFGEKAIPFLESINTKRSRELVAKIKGRESWNRIKNFFVKN